MFHFSLLFIIEPKTIKQQHHKYNKCTKHKHILIVVCCHECCIIFEDRKSLTSHQWIYNHRKVDLNRLSEENRRRREREEALRRKKAEERAAKSNQIYCCDYNGCNKIFTRFGVYNKHRKTHIKKYRCSYIHSGCNREFSTRKALEIHERIHSKERKEICKFCLGSFTDPAALRKHIKYIHKMIIVTMTNQEME